MERFTKEEAERMGAFEETGLAWEDVVKSKQLEEKAPQARPSAASAAEESICGENA
jgi:hypothetical protein